MKVNVQATALVTSATPFCNCGIQFDVPTMVRMTMCNIRWIVHRQIMKKYKMLANIYLQVNFCKGNKDIQGL